MSRIPLAGSTLALALLFTILGPIAAVRPLASDLLQKVSDEAEVDSTESADLAWWPFDVVKQWLKPAVAQKPSNATNAAAKSTSSTAPTQNSTFGAKVVNALKVVSTLGAKVVNATKWVASAVSNTAASAQAKASGVASKLSELQNHWTNLTIFALNQGKSLKLSIERFGERAGELMVTLNATRTEFHSIVVQLVLLDEQWGLVSEALVLTNQALRNATALVGKREQEYTLLIKSSSGNLREELSQSLAAFRYNWGNASVNVRLHGAVLYNATVTASKTVSKLIDQLRTSAKSKRDKVLADITLLRQFWANLTVQAHQDEAWLKNATKNLVDRTVR